MGKIHQVLTRKSPMKNSASVRKSAKKSTPMKKSSSSGSTTNSSEENRSSTSSTASGTSSSTEDLANDSKFWDVIAPDYDTEILSTIDANTCPSILKVIKKYCGEDGVYGRENIVAADFGCGVGKYLPTLAKYTKLIVGMDFSKGLLNFAKQKTTHLNNVGILPALSLTNTKMVKNLLGDQIRESKLASKNHDGLVDFGVCTNVLLSPDPAVQTAILKTLSACVKPGGHLLLLVPSAESHLWTVWSALKGPGSSEPDIFMDFYAAYCNPDLKKNGKNNGPNGAGAPVSRMDTALNIVPRGDEGVRTQHFLREQIIEMCNTAGFKTLDVEKSMYAWNTEIDFEALDEGRVGKGYGKKVEKRFENLNSGPWDWVLTLEKKA